MMKFACGVVFFGNGAIGFALPLVTQVEQVVNLMKLIAHPEGLRVRLSIACHQAHATIGGQAETGEMMRLERVKMRFPGRGRTVSGQLDTENRGTVRLNRDQNGAV